MNLELYLVWNEPISMTNIFIRCSSHGLFAEGVKEIRRMYCAITKILLAYLLIFLIDGIVYERKIKIVQSYILHLLKNSKP